MNTEPTRIELPARPPAEAEDSGLDSPASTGLHQYRVRIGHTEVIVGGSNAAEAVQLARRQLANELPRLWDVIYRMSDEEFRVEEVR